MKARLAKKLAHTPIDRLAPKWLMRLYRGDARLARALSKWEKILADLLPEEVLDESKNMK